MGQKPTLQSDRRMSVLPPKADVRVTQDHVRFGPFAAVGAESAYWLSREIAATILRRLNGVPRSDLDAISILGQ